MFSHAAIRSLFDVLFLWAEVKSDRLKNVPTIDVSGNDDIGEWEGKKEKKKKGDTKVH